MVHDTEYQQIAELAKFLTSSNIRLQVQTSEVVFGLTANTSTLKSLYSHQELVQALVKLIGSSYPQLDENVMKTLVNLSAEELATDHLMDPSLQLPSVLIKALVNPDYKMADFAAIILGNLTRNEKSCTTVLETLESGDTKLEDFVKIYGNLGYNKHKASLQAIGFILTNFSHIEKGRKKIMDSDSMLFRKLIPFIKCSESKLRQRAMLQLLRNCCLQEQYHKELLADDLGLVSTLVLPLVSGKDITEEENDQLPEDLQFLDEDKEIEKDIEVKTSLLECISMLAIRTNEGKRKIKKMNILPLLRQYYNAEENDNCKELVMDIIGGLLLDEKKLSSKWTEEGGVLLSEKPDVEEDS